MPGVSHRDKFINELIAVGGSSGNRALNKRLNWSEERYWRIRNELVADGKVVIGSGSGGSVRLSSRAKYTAEKHLYQPLRDALDRSWRDQEWNADEVSIEVTANFGKKTLGRWSQPDLCAISRRTYKYLAQKHVDLWTFEVKPLGEMSVEHVLEAVAHSRYSHRSYVMFHIEHESDLESIRFAHCRAEAERHSIGLITFRNPEKYSDFRWHRESLRREPNPEHLNEFIEQQLSEPMQNQILKWLK